MNLYCILVCLCDMNCSVMGDWYCMTKVLDKATHDSKIQQRHCCCSIPPPSEDAMGVRPYLYRVNPLSLTANTKRC